MNQVKKYISYIIVFLTVTLSNPIGAQCDGFAGSIVASDTLQCTGEETILTLLSTSESVTWIYSEDGVNWEPLVGYYGTSITVFPEVNTSYATYYTDGSSCRDTSNMVTVKVSSFDDIPNIEAGYDVCGLTGWPTAVYPNDGSLYKYWTLAYGPGDALFNLDSTVNVNEVVVDTGGIYGFAWNLSDGTCTKDSIAEFTFNEYPVANAGIDTNYCSATFNLNASLYFEKSSGQWKKLTQFPITFSNDTLYNTLVTGASTGKTHQLLWTETSEAGCTDSDTVEIAVATMPSATAGDDDKICGNDYQLSATSSNYSSKWEWIDGPVSIEFSSSTSETATVTAAEYGEYELQWIVVNSFCVARDTVVLNFFENPVADAGIASDTCGNKNILSAIASVGNGTWSQYNGAGEAIIDSLNNAQTNVSVGSDYGPYSFVWEENNNGCTDSDTLDVSFYEIPVANAGIDADTCGNAGFLDAELSVEGATGNWSYYTGPIKPAISDTTQSRTTVNVDTAFGTYMFYWTENNNECIDRDTITFIFNKIPLANAGTAEDVCGNETILGAVFSMVSSTGSWSTDSDIPLIVSPNADSTTVDVGTSYGKYSFIWTETSSQGCPDTDTISGLNFKESPVANAGTGGTVCSDSVYSFQLSGGLSIGSGYWTYEGEGSLTFYPDSLTPDASITSEAEGSYILTWRESANGCTDSSTIEIGMHTQPEVTIMSDAKTCGESIQLEAGASLGDTKWSQYSGNGTVTFSDEASTSTRASIVDGDYGEYIFQWEAENNGCSDSAFVAIIFNEQPETKAGSDTSVCGTTYTLNAQSSVGEAGWYCVNLPGQISFSPDTTSSTVAVAVTGAGSYMLVWTETNDNCTDSDTLRLTFLETPEADAGEDQELDNKFETTMLANVPEDDEQGSWQLVSGTGVIGLESSYNTDITDMDIGENVFTWTVTNDLCESVDSVKITVYDIFIPQVITPNGDGDNDIFYIKGIDDLENIELTIMNRWGGEVYYSPDYENDWDGTNKNGEELTNDTYFYVLRITDTRIVKSYVIIKR